jgi:transposase
MSEEARRVEVITSVQRRRRWSVAEKIRLVEETLEPGMSVSFVARKHGLSPSRLFKWRPRMAAGGREAVRVDDEVIAAARVRQREERILGLGFFGLMTTGAHHQAHHWAIATGQPVHGS